MFWVVLIGLILSTLFNILNYLQNKKNHKASIYIDKLLITPTPENINIARGEAQSITASTSTLSLMSRPIALADPVREGIMKARVKLETKTHLDKIIEEIEKDKEKK